MTAPGPKYTYAATVLRWVDGDTVDLAVDVGFHITMNDRFRLYGIDTPERGEVNHDEAWHYAQGLAPVGAQVVVKTYRQEKYGRWLATIFPSGSDVSVNSDLVRASLAYEYYGGTKTHD